MTLRFAAKKEKTDAGAIPKIWKLFEGGKFHNYAGQPLSYYKEWTIANTLTREGEKKEARRSGLKVGTPPGWGDLSVYEQGVVHLMDPKGHSRPECRHLGECCRSPQR